MAEGIKQGVNSQALQSLVEALTVFIDGHKPGNPSISQAVEAATSEALQLLTSKQSGIAIVSTAIALRDFAKSGGMTMQFRRPYPSE